jgi:DAACS family dicarboxylate/amino acid:cation (Na+ or H+) symporter
LWIQIVIGLIVGCAIGFLWPKFGTALQPFGTAFIKAFKMIVIPLVFSAVTLGIYKMSADFKALGKLAGLAFAWFYFATGCSVALGIILNAIFHPGAGVALKATGSIPANLAHSIDWVKFLLDIIPDNIVLAASQQKIIPTLFFAICFGIALGKAGKITEPTVNMLQGIMQAMFKLTEGIVAFSPLAVASIMAWVVATQGGSMLRALAELVGVMYLGLVVVAILFCIIVSLLGYPPLATIKKVAEPLLLGFSTASSEVTLPVHMQILEKAGIPNRIVSFVLPLGYSFNLDGSALYQSLTVCFLAEAYGLHLDLASILTILITTLIANKGTANVAGSSLVVFAVILTAINLPVEAIAIIAGVDRLMDMGRTAVNIFGNTTATMLLYRFGGKGIPEVESAMGTTV